MPSRRTFAIPLLIFLLVLTTATALPASGKAKKKPKPPPPVEVGVGGGPIAILWTWDPETVTIPVGGSVRWTNDSGAPHNVAAYSPNWTDHEAIEEGTPVTLRFDEPGTYLYNCDVVSHSVLVGDMCFGMCGSVVVE